MAATKGFQLVPQQDCDDDLQEQTALPRRVQGSTWYPPIYAGLARRGLTPKIAIVLAILFQISVFYFGFLVASRLYKSQLLVDDHNRLPQFPVSRVEFQAEVYFVGDRLAVDDAWNSLLPEGMGFVNVTTPDGREVKAGTAVFHQIHCLNQIRLHVRALEHPDLPYNHNITSVAQCIEYLRNSILCAADMTLEEHWNGEKEVEGWGYTHQCRDADSVIDWIAQHRSSDDVPEILSPEPVCKRHNTDC